MGIWYFGSFPQYSSSRQHYRQYRPLMRSRYMAENSGPSALGPRGSFELQPEQYPSTHPCPTTMDDDRNHFSPSDDGGRQALNDTQCAPALPQPQSEPNGFQDQPMDLTAMADVQNEQTAPGQDMDVGFNTPDGHSGCRGPMPTNVEHPFPAHPARPNVVRRGSQTSHSSVLTLRCRYPWTLPIPRVD